jgi:hypothetical protein
MTTEPITLQLSPELLAMAQELAGSPENLHNFLIRAIEHEVQRTQPFTQKSRFWESVERLQTEMAAEGIEIDPDEIWGNVRSRSPGREIKL